MAAGEAADVSDAEDIQKPQRVLARSAGLDALEDHLRRAIIVTAISAQEFVPLEPIAVLLAQRFGLVSADMELRHLLGSEFLLALQDEAMVARVLEDGRPMVSQSFRLHLARWTCYF